MDYRITISENSGDPKTRLHNSVVLTDELIEQIKGREGRETVYGAMIESRIASIKFNRQKADCNQEKWANAAAK